MMQELDTVVLADDLPDLALQAGDVGTIVLVHEGGEGYEVEFTTLDGKTVAVATLESSQLRPAAQQEIAHARTVVG